MAVAQIVRCCIGIAACAPIIFSQAHAEMTGEQYLALVGEVKDLKKFGLSETENGMSWANTELRARGQPRLYCVPEKMAMSPDQADTILRSYLDEHPEQAKYPVALILLRAMEETFPCSQRG